MSNLLFYCAAFRRPLFRYDRFTRASATAALYPWRKRESVSPVFPRSSSRYMVAWHLPTRSAISPGFAPFAYISSIIRRSSSFKHSYFITSPPFLRKKISASELISSFALNDKRHIFTFSGKLLLTNRKIEHILLKQNKEERCIRSHPQQSEGVNRGKQSLRAFLCHGTGAECSVLVFCLPNSL